MKLVKLLNFDGSDIYINIDQVLCVAASDIKDNTIIYIKDGSAEYYEVQGDVKDIVGKLC